ncbi:MAG: rhomboid family intramembrane serine protease [Chloroflexi bacterium]|nr:rhomboid family intramembrane serine protease [Chloroflexota bacterium]
MIPIGDSPVRQHRTPWMMLLLLAANVAVFAYELSLGRAVDSWTQSVGTIPFEILRGQDLPPPAPGPVYVTLVTSMFVHGGFLHLGSNMLYLWVFGDNVEDVFGHARFLAFYLVSGLIASLTHIYFNPDSTIPSVGASGAIAGILGGYLLMFPNARIRTLLLLGPFLTVTRVSALFVIGIWFLSQLLSGLASLEAVTAQSSGVAVWAHVGGFIAGVVLGFAFRPHRPAGHRIA